MLQAIRNVFCDEYPGFSSLPDRVAHSFAWLINEIQSKHRQHRKYSGYAYFHRDELNAKFGCNPRHEPQNNFHYYNRKLKLVEVSGHYSKKKEYTKAYRLSEQAIQVICKLYSVIEDEYFDSEYVNKVLSSKKRFKRGFAKKGKKLTKRVPINGHQLSQLKRELIRQRDFLLKYNKSVVSIDYRLHAITSLQKKAVAGVVTDIYKQTKTGRWQAFGTSLQMVPKSIREAALHGFYSTDIDNCHYTVIQSLTTLKTPCIEDYIANKQTFRHEIANDLQVDIITAKKCLIAMMYGASSGLNNQCAIVQYLGINRARQFWQQPFVCKLKDETDLVTTDILNRWIDQTRYSYCNRQNLLISKKEPPRKILAHILQGEESAMMEAIRVEYPDILSLEFDGFTSSIEIPSKNIQQTIKKATGHTITTTTTQHGHRQQTTTNKKQPLVHSSVICSGI